MLGTPGGTARVVSKFFIRFQALLLCYVTCCKVRGQGRGRGPLTNKGEVFKNANEDRHRSKMYPFCAENKTES